MFTAMQSKTFHHEVLSHFGIIRIVSSIGNEIACNRERKWKLRGEETGQEKKK